MKALMLTAYRQLELIEMDAPAPGPDEVLIRVNSCGICGSDIHGYDGSSGRRIPPLVMGHEAAGTIAARGEAVTHLQVGDRVTMDSTVYCGRCEECRQGRINLCQNRNVLGVSCGDYRRHGAFAEYLSVPAHIVYRLPDDLPFEHAALIESVSIAVHAVNRTPVRLGDTGLVIGSGMIGLLVIQALRRAGCTRVIAVDLDEGRLERAAGVGADELICAAREDTVARVMELTQGRGADVGCEVVGASSTVRAAVESVRRGGAITLVGNLAPQVELPLQLVVTRELSLHGACGSCGEYPVCMDLMSRGEIDVRPLISAAVPLEEGPRWFERLYAGEPGLMKVILQP